MAALPPSWASILTSLDFAFQPIVSVHSGECLGFECLLRGYDAADFSSIHSVFDRAHDEQVLYSVDLALREKAIAKFRSYIGHRVKKLFYNLDIRVLDAPGYSRGVTKKLLEAQGLSTGNLCLEVSEQQRMLFDSKGRDVLSVYREQGFSIAIDDYGIGFSGPQRLYECETDYLKIDGFFLSDIATSGRKRLFVAHMVGLAHVLGIQVIAEHVATAEQFYACKTVGCDFVQGYLSGVPTLVVEDLALSSDVVRDLNRQEKRGAPTEKRIVLEQVETVEAIPWNASMEALLEAFRRRPQCSFVPVVNALREPLGIVREPDIKEFVYSRYGRELLTNPVMSGRLLEFVTRCPLAEVGMGLDKMLEVFSNAQNAEVLLLTEGSRYRGFLRASSLLVALNEKNLAIARDQNPLTRLPGNSLIAAHMGEALRNEAVDKVFAYFDLDNFKCFNDVYGFRQGDRAILLLADTLKEAAHSRGIFLGHIGGDDLFAAFSGPEWKLPNVINWATAVVEKFNLAALSFFTPDDRTRGYLVAEDRSGVRQHVPLLSVSCAVLALSAGAPTLSTDTLGAAIARCKKAAKKSPHRLHVASLAREELVRQHPTEPPEFDRFAFAVNADWMSQT